MTKAFNKALDLYPAPEAWEPARGIQRKLSAEEQAAATRAIMLRGSLTSDEWPRMVRAFRMVMQRPLPSEPTPLPPADKEHHATLLTRAVADFAAADGTVEQAHQAFNIVYYAISALNHLGLTDNAILAGFAEVHASNMTKVQDSGKPLVNDGLIAPDEPIGKVLKTHNYVRPALAEAMAL